MLQAITCRWIRFKNKIQVNNQSFIQSTDMIQLTLTLKMITAQIFEMSVTVNNSAIQDYTKPRRSWLL